MCLNKVKLNCGDEAGVWNVVHVPSKHMFKMQQICAYTMAWRCPFSTLTPQQERKKDRGEERSRNSREAKSRRQIQTEMVLWSESFWSVCLSSAPNEWQMLQGGLLTTVKAPLTDTHTYMESLPLSHTQADTNSTVYSLPMWYSVASIYVWLGAGLSH